MSKKNVRQKFRDLVFTRDKHVCRVCKAVGGELDAHHITDRNLMPGGGYVPGNGISLCKDCHLKAEHFHSTGTSLPGFSPEDLYQLIGSSYAEALRDLSTSLVKPH